MITHCHLDVRGAIKTMNNRQLGQMFRRADGTSLSASEAKDALLDHLAQGHAVIPVGPECIGFDYAGGGCPGHESDSVAYPSDSKCVGCGCTDSCACVNETTSDPCHWLRLDRSAKTGVCSECGHLVSAWDAGAHRNAGPASKREKA